MKGKSSPDMDIDSGAGIDVDIRGPKDHINIRILQTMASWYPPYIGPWNQIVRS